MLTTKGLMKDDRNKQQGNIEKQNLNEKSNITPGLNVQGQNQNNNIKQILNYKNINVSKIMGNSSDNENNENNDNNDNDDMYDEAFVEGDAKTSGNEVRTETQKGEDLQSIDDSNSNSMSQNKNDNVIPSPGAY